MGANSAITAMMDSRMMLAMAARLRNSRRRASTHRLRPLMAPLFSITSALKGLPMAIMPVFPSCQPSPRIQKCQQDVGNEIQEYDQGGVTEHDTHHQRVIAVERGLH